MQSIPKSGTRRNALTPAQCEHMGRIEKAVFAECESALDAVRNCRCAEAVTFLQKVGSVTREVCTRTPERFNEVVTRCDLGEHDPDADVLAALRAICDTVHRLGNEYGSVKNGDVRAVSNDEHAEPNDGDCSAPLVAAWPEPLAAEAFYGLPGEFVRLVEPFSEADPAAVLFSFLAGAGAALGRESVYDVSGTSHGPNLFVALIGSSATARKGTSYAPVERALRLADECFADSIASGLASGEGIIWHVRDGSGKDDTGVDDKRLLIVEEEFAGALRAGSRQGSTLSAVLRRAWDSGALRTLAKNSPCRATGAHIGMIAHCTLDELRATLCAVDVRNGFSNRVLWVCARRSKSLPDGGTIPHNAMMGIASRLREAVEFAATPRTVSMTPAARDIWRAVYESLNQERPGNFGAVTARAPAQVIRLALAYALLDLAPDIRPEHLTAALAVWQYADASAAHVFADQSDDRAVQRVRDAIGIGATRSQLRDLFPGSQRDEKLDAALGVLKARGEIEEVPTRTGGRPATLYRPKRGAA